MKPFDEMTSVEYKEYEKRIAFGEVALIDEIDFIYEKDSNFVICKSGDIKVNPDSEFRKYLILLFKQKKKALLKEKFSLLKK